ncbi:MAG: methyltransferase domain-containing protein, partial [Cyanobacteria bacterium SZAS LIN-2]|nr:methyltransferase domain-containing protein [Cyanobacteria bacterium SZAS LIN-2]
GNGRMAIKLAGEARTVTGIDLDSELVEFAADYARTNSIFNLQFKEMSALQLDVADESFDFVLMPWVLHLIKDRTRALREAERVLRPSGTLMIFGVWGDCDYDRIARHFVAGRDPEINPRQWYELPLKEVFGSFEQEELPRDQTFSFIFPDCGVTVEAFNFAFKNWHDHQMSEKELNHLRHLLHDYGLDSRIELKTRGAIYACRKRGAKR